MTGYTWGEWLVLAAVGLGVAGVIVALSGLIVFVVDRI